MREMRLDHLRTLMEVAALGSFSAAARKLNLSQPAISLQVRELENRTGVTLLHREGKRAVATAAGRELIAHGRALLDAAERARLAMRRHKEGRIGRVRIGTGATSLIYRMQPALKRLRARYPAIDIEMTTGITPHITELMLADKIDVGLVTLPVDGRAFHVRPAGRSSLLAILPPGTKNPPARMTPARLVTGPLILESEGTNQSLFIRAWLRDAGLEARPVMEFDNIEAIKTVVAAGLGHAVIPGLAVATPAARGGLIVRPLQPALSYALGLIHRRDRPLDEAASIVLKELAMLGKASR